MKPAPFELVRPTSLDDAIRHLSGQDGMAKAMAGGQSLVPMLNLRLAPLEKVVDLSRIAELKVVCEEADKVVFGACVTHATIEDGLTPDPAGGLMRRVAANIAYRAVRNRGTIGGSVALADPAAEWVSLMILLDAVVELRGAAGPREIPARDFVMAAYTTALGEEELLTGLAVPKFSASARYGYYKMCRKTGEFANSITMIALDPARGYCRAVLGATGGAPIILEQTQDRLSRGHRSLDDAVDADLSTHAGFDEFDKDIHRASILSAVREALSNG
jgi:carbon-monoxide dehydrogenase medium subunit